jgi:hypothetical protein
MPASCRLIVPGCIASFALRSAAPMTPKPRSHVSNCKLDLLPFNCTCQTSSARTSYKPGNPHTTHSHMTALFRHVQPVPNDVLLQISGSMSPGERQRLRGVCAVFLHAALDARYRQFSLMPVNEGRIRKPFLSAESRLLAAAYHLRCVFHTILRRLPHNNLFVIESRMSHDVCESCV